MAFARSGERLKSLFSAQDMSKGAPWKRILEFSLPMLIGNLAQQMYNTADSVIVGYYVGDNALAAVGSASPILNLLLALFVGVSTGAGILVAQYYGAREKENLSNVIGNCMTLTIIVSAIIMIIGPLVTRPLLSLLGTPESIFNWCSDYLIIYFLGILGFAAYNIFSGILRGLGDSFSALAFLIVATILNIGLDIWFVASFRMGVAGVALATIIAQFISAILCLIKLMHMHDVFVLKAKHLKIRGSYAGKVIKLGVPSGVTQAIFSMAMLVVQSLTNSFGEMVIACNVIVMRVDGFAMMPNFTFGQAMTTFTGQNVGAGRLDRVRSGAKQGTIMALICACILTACILLFGPNLMAIFTDTAELVDLSVHMMSILAVGYIAMAVTQSLSGVMRGAGDTMTPMWISLITTVVLRVPIAYGLAALTKSPDSVFISLLCSWVLGAVITFIAYRMGRWRKRVTKTFSEAEA
ncbi:MAG TPA: MATE family efflux transporter [Candidatus Gallacutalibacter pullicola]|uniref:MATE family efflux transporter n=1 Tax=Candidatus Gallacutalibacter pullicola TaxID=2840830 RepID=A0A9D1DRQ1_9FIRM|nr:MATE family efflux transporter [Candidatus Gallacutalibacter pullicola]